MSNFWGAVQFFPFYSYASQWGNLYFHDNANSYYFERGNGNNTYFLVWYYVS